MSRYLEPSSRGRVIPAAGVVATRLWRGRQPPRQPRAPVRRVIATLGLLLVIFAIVRSGRAATAPAAVGAYIGAAYWFTSFANPAISVGRMFSDTFAGIAPASVSAFVVAQLVGGAVAYGLIRVLCPDVTSAWAAEVVVPHDDVLQSAR
jgi:hypothetical protein